MGFASNLCRYLHAAAALLTLGLLTHSAPAKTAAPPDEAPPIHLKNEQHNTQLVLNQNADYLLENVNITGLTDYAALTLTGPINSITLRNCRFGDISMPGEGHSAAVQAMGASIRSFTATDSVFYDAAGELLSLRNGTFGIVTIEHCAFRNSESFLKRLYHASPWRKSPPLTEFYNIDHLELLDNEFENTTIIIHSSVKTVVLRGSDLSHVQVESPDTQVLRMDLRDLDEASDGVATAAKAAVAPSTPMAASALKSDKSWVDLFALLAQ